MGYSISIDARSTKLQNRMLEFCKAEFKHWAVVLGGEDDIRYISDPQKDLDYAHHKLQIGFDYNGLGDEAERFYYWSFLRWMALKVGQRKSKLRWDSGQGEWTKFPEPVPFTIYDGWDHWPVLLKKPRKKILWCWMDQLGMQRDPEALAKRFMQTFWEQMVNFATDGAFGWEWKPEIKKLIPEDVTDHLDRRMYLIRIHFWGELQERTKPIRAELERLDGLWTP